MSANLLLYSSHDITGEELAEVILEAGGIIPPESAAGYFGGIIDDGTAIWITPIAWDDGVFDDEGNFLDEDGAFWLEGTKKLLGGEPKACLYISLDYHPLRDVSELLAARFALLCCDRWPCILDNNHGRIFSREEIERWYQEGDSFLRYTSERYKIDEGRRRALLEEFLQFIGRSRSQES